MERPNRHVLPPIRSTFVLALIVLNFVLTSKAQVNSQQIAGVIEDESSGKPVAQALVDIVGAFAEHPAVTDDEGKFMMRLTSRAVAGQELRIRVTKRGYMPSDKMTVLSSEFVPIVIRLRRKRSDLAERTSSSARERSRAATSAEPVTITDLHVGPAVIAPMQSIEMSMVIRNTTDGLLRNLNVHFEVYDAADHLLQKLLFSGISLDSGEEHGFQAQTQLATPGIATVRAGVFTEDYGKTLAWLQSGEMVQVRSEVVARAPKTSYEQPLKIQVLSPSDNQHVGGQLQFSATLIGVPPAQYQMFWYVDSKNLIRMASLHDDPKLKAAPVEFEGWTWNGNGPYLVTFRATDVNGRILAEKSVRIYVSQH